MTSIQVKFRPSVVSNREGSVYYLIIHNRKMRQLLSSCKIYQTEWDAGHSCVMPDRLHRRVEYIATVRRQIRSDIERINRIVRHLERDHPSFSINDIINEYRNYTAESTLFKYMIGIIDRLKDNGRVRTAETYLATLRSFSKFLHGTDPLIDTISPTLIEDYEGWLQQRGLTPNTSSFYIRILRAVYNRAVDAGLTDNMQPFRHVYTGIDKTVKRALPLRCISRLKTIDLSDKPALDYARDMFIMSFMLRGMSFIDMAFLRKSDLKSGYITYRRRKTGRLLIVKWTRQMQEIVDKYCGADSPFLLPIIRRPGSNERNLYRNTAYTINRNLKYVAVMAGIEVPLTLYVARHSWATAAKSKGIPLAVISEGMGHDSEATTSIYLASLDTSAVDRANSKILASL